jgi:UDP:flavonoid glycosyltransferase YjiC (YdhE family)
MEETGRDQALAPSRGIMVNGQKTRKPPFIVMSAAPNEGHTAPALHLCRELVKRGFEVIFASTPEFEARIHTIGAEFFESTSFWPTPTTEAERDTQPPGLPKLLFDLERVFIASTPGRAQKMRELLEMLHQRDSERPVVILVEAMSLGCVPFLWGAPLPKGYDCFPPAIAFNVIPLVVSSVDTSPTGLGLPPDATESGRARNAALYQMLARGPFATIEETQRRTLVDECGCTRYDYQGVNHLDVWLNSYDTCFQMCTPSLEFPRSDLHPSIRFAGALPKRGLDPNLQYPDWWMDDVVDNKAGRKIVPVAQGTVAVNYDEVIVPALRAFEDRDDVLVIAILGLGGATLPPGVEVPRNARVVDYLPYDAALAHADLFVTNGGYGSMCHAVINGVPMVVAGVTEDKVEVTARAEYAGLAVNLKTQNPTPEMIREAAERVLAEKKFKERAVRLMRENRDLDCLAVVEREIWHYVETRY